MGNIKRLYLSKDTTIAAGEIFFLYFPTNGKCLGVVGWSLGGRELGNKLSITGVTKTDDYTAAIAGRNIASSSCTITTNAYVDAIVSS